MRREVCANLIHTHLRTFLENCPWPISQSSKTLTGLQIKHCPPRIECKCCSQCALIAKIDRKKNQIKSTNSIRRKWSVWYLLDPNRKQCMPLRSLKYSAESQSADCRCQLKPNIVCNLRRNKRQTRNNVNSDFRQKINSLFSWCMKPNQLAKQLLIISLCIRMIQLKCQISNDFIKFTMVHAQGDEQQKECTVYK